MFRRSVSRPLVRWIRLFSPFLNLDLQGSNIVPARTNENLHGFTHFLYVDNGIVPEVVCMYESKRCGSHPAPEQRPSLIFCASPLISFLWIPHSEWNIGLYLWGRHESHLVLWRNYEILIASQSYGTCNFYIHRLRSENLEDLLQSGEHVLVSVLREQ
jgi:hypothetical protein